MKLGTVSELWRYPVSSMGGESLSQCAIVDDGILFDRIWGVVDQKTGEVAGPEKRRYWRPLPNLSSRHGAKAPEVSNGDGRWLSVLTPEAQILVSKHLGFPVNLRPHSQFEQDEEGMAAPRYARADIHIVTSSSMATLSELVHDRAQVDSRRFRPSIVIQTEGQFTGFVEHDIVGKVLEMGAVRLTVTEPCKRCAFTSLAQGELSFEPAILHKIAQHSTGGFGAYCKVVEPGEIVVGQTVVLREA